MTPTASTGKRLRRPERRAAILDAAAHAFAPAGYAATSMADIAQAAGVSHLIVYRHFETKEQLYEGVLERARATLAEALCAEGATGSHGPTPAALLRAARVDTASFRVLWRHAAREPQFARHADRAREHLLELTATALAPSVAPDFARWAARATVAYVIESVLVWVEDGDEHYDGRFVASTQAALRAGIRSWSRPA
jgi:AcrR family transcriptional regulator